jgi:aspartate kinase
MSIIVQKYGGSSVATPEKLRQVAARIVATRKLGHRVVVVVSAMGNTTNELLALARSVSPNPQRRELDMLITTGERISMALLSMAIQDLGHPAVSFTGSQSGIITTDNHTNARIIKITPFRLLQALEQDRIVIVAGFQGVSERREITSLGRGGSDTTAVALAAALGADYAEICSDVDGVYSADPRVVPEARRLDEISYEEMQVLADAGAKVLNAEAVEWARRENIEIRCVATAGDASVGTPVKAAASVTHPRVVSVTAHPGLFVLEPESPGAPPPADLESTLAAHVNRRFTKLGPQAGRVEALELVYRLEVSGEVLYQGLADRVADPEAKELLRRNGVEERGHARRIAKVLTIRTGAEWTPSAEHEEILAVPLPDTVDANFFLAVVQGEIAGDAGYQRWADRETDPEIERLLRLNGREETIHAERAQAVHEILSR